MDTKQAGQKKRYKNKDLVDKVRAALQRASAGRGGRKSRGKQRRQRGGWEVTITKAYALELFNKMYDKSSKNTYKNKKEKEIRYISYNDWKENKAYMFGDGMTNNQIRYYFIIFCGLGDYDEMSEGYEDHGQRNKVIHKARLTFGKFYAQLQEIANEDNDTTESEEDRKMMSGIYEEEAAMDADRELGLRGGRSRRRRRRRKSAKKTKKRRRRRRTKRRKTAKKSRRRRRRRRK